MNRPQKELYLYEDEDYELMVHNAYVSDLEKYCAELEHELEVLKEEHNADQKYIEDWDTTKDWFWKKIKRLEKALYKACKILEFNDKSSYCDKSKTKEQWKEWLLEDE